MLRMISIPRTANRVRTSAQSHTSIRYSCQLDIDGQSYLRFAAEWLDWLGFFVSRRLDSWLICYAKPFTFHVELSEKIWHDAFFFSSQPLELSNWSKFKCCVYTAHVIYERACNRKHTHNTHHIGIAINEFDFIFYGFIADESARIGTQNGPRHEKRVDVDASSSNAHNSHAIQMCFVMSIFEQFLCVCVGCGSNSNYLYERLHTRQSCGYTCESSRHECFVYHEALYSKSSLIRLNDECLIAQWQP